MANETAWLILTVFAILNVCAFIMVGADKVKSINNDRRVPEVQFFIWSAFFSSLGILLGIFVFRHKSRKLYFVLGTFLIFAQQLLLLGLLLNWI